jgi:hypothetical protein
VAFNHFRLDLRFEAILRIDRPAIAKFHNAIALFVAEVLDGRSQTLALEEIAHPPPKLIERVV